MSLTVETKTLTKETDTQLASSSSTAHKLIIQADPANTKTLFIGPKGAKDKGFPLAKGEKVELEGEDIGSIYAYSKEAESDKVSYLMQSYT